MLKKQSQTVPDEKTLSEDVRDENEPPHEGLGTSDQAEGPASAELLVIKRQKRRPVSARLPCERTPPI